MSWVPFAGAQARTPRALIFPVVKDLAAGRLQAGIYRVRQPLRPALHSPYAGVAGPPRRISLQGHLRAGVHVASAQAKTAVRRIRPEQNRLGEVAAPHQELMFG